VVQFIAIPAHYPALLCAVRAIVVKTKANTTNAMAAVADGTKRENVTHTI